MRCVRLCFISIYVYMKIKCIDTLLVVYTGAYRMLYICIYIYFVYCITVNEQSFVLHLDLVLLFVS